MCDDPPEGQRTQETQKDVRAKREGHPPEGQRTQETQKVCTLFSMLYACLQNLQGCYSARTVPVQCPYSARTVPVDSARISFA